MALSTVGPLLTMYNVRTSTQAFHNNAEVGLLKELWERGYGVKLDIATFELEKKVPLSWATHRRRAAGDPQRLGRAAEPGVAGGGEGAVPGGAVRKPDEN